MNKKIKNMDPIHLKIFEEQKENAPLLELKINEFGHTRKIIDIEIYQTNNKVGVILTYVPKIKIGEVQNG